MRTDPKSGIIYMQVGEAGRFYVRVRPLGSPDERTMLLGRWNAWPHSTEADSERNEVMAGITIKQDLAFEILDVLRTAPFYMLMGSESEDELGDDFKPHKWQGFEVEAANEATAAYRSLLSQMDGQVEPLKGTKP